METPIAPVRISMLECAPLAERYSGELVSHDHVLRIELATQHSTAGSRPAVDELARVGRGRESVEYEDAGDRSRCTRSPHRRRETNEETGVLGRFLRVERVSTPHPAHARGWGVWFFVRSTQGVVTSARMGNRRAPPGTVAQAAAEQPGRARRRRTIIPWAESRDREEHDAETWV